MYACRYGNFELLQIFYALGFKIDISNLVSLVHLTCYSENMKIIDYLLNDADISPLEMTNLLRISAMLIKQEIALYFMIHGGFFIDDSAEPGAVVQYMNVFPKQASAASKEEPIVCSSKTEGNQSSKVLKISDQKK